MVGEFLTVPYHSASNPLGHKTSPHARREVKFSRVSDVAELIGDNWTGFWNQARKCESETQKEVFCGRVDSEVGRD